MASSSWSVKHYESTTYVDDSKTSISFSIKIQGIEKEAVEIVSEIPRNFLDNGKETCNRFLVNVLSKAKIHSSIQNNIVPNISKKAIELNCFRDRGFLVKLEVEAAVEETTNSGGEEDCCQISTDVDCLICGEELSLYDERALIMLMCSHKHTFHEGCFSPRLYHNSSCPTCGENIIPNSLVQTSNYLRPNKKKTYIMIRTYALRQNSM